MDGCWPFYRPSPFILAVVLLATLHGPGRSHRANAERESDADGAVKRNATAHRHTRDLRSDTAQDVGQAPPPKKRVHAGGGRPLMHREFEAVKKAENNIYREIDTDGNGRISRDEFSNALKYPRDKSKFDLIDTSGDGFIDEVEFKAAFEPHNNGETPPRFHVSMFKVDGTQLSLFAAIDTRRDGKINEKEFELALKNPGLHKGKFKEVDVNGDGLIDAHEFAEAMTPSGDREARINKHMFTAGGDVLGDGRREPPREGGAAVARSGPATAAAALALAAASAGWGV